jgi:hypothetical protein
VAITVTDRILEVLDHLGIERAHFAASMLADLADFAPKAPRRIASLTLVCPPRLDSSLRDLGDRLQIISGDQGRPASMVREAVNSLPEAKVIWLPGYFSPPWADPVADFTTHVETALSNVVSGEPLRSNNQEQNSEGIVAGISYRCEGKGTPPCAATAELSFISVGPSITAIERPVSHYCSRRS